MDSAVRPLCPALRPQRRLRLPALGDVRRGDGDVDRGRSEPVHSPRRQHMSRAGVIEHTIDGLRSAMERALYADSVAERGGLLQQLDPRVKVLGLLALIVAAALSRRLSV